MLKKAWDNAVYGYQTLRQSMDAQSLHAIDERLKDAREGRQVYYVTPTRFMGVGSVHIITLTPEQQKNMIEQGEKTRAELVAEMEQRRARYGLRM
jgi:hypothetical protein